MDPIGPSIAFEFARGARLEAVGPPWDDPPKEVLRQRVRERAVTAPLSLDRERVQFDPEIDFLKNLGRPPDFLNMAGFEGPGPQEEVGPYSVAGANGRSRFSAARMGKRLADETPFAKTPGGQLWVYRKGRYHDDGEDSIKRRVTGLMGDVWRPQHSSETVEWLRSRADTFENAPSKDLIIVENGYLRVNANGVEFTEGAAPELLTPVSLPVKWDPKARAPVLAKFLRTSLVDKELIALVQEWCGLCLVPDNDYQKALLNQGVEGGGKSKLIGALVRLVGQRNCSSRHLHEFDNNRFAPYDLYGKLLNAAADISSRELSSSAKFREITGGDYITAEQKHQDSFSFQPYARLMFSLNKFPAFRDPTPAVFDRWIVVPWERKFRGTTGENRRLHDDLTTPEALSGMLRWSVDGLIRLRRQDGFTESARSAAALDRFRRESDVVSLFLEDEKETGALKPGCRVERGQLWSMYVAWCSETEHETLGRNNFYDRVAALFGNPVKSNGERLFNVR